MRLVWGGVLVVAVTVIAVGVLHSEEASPAREAFRPPPSDAGQSMLVPDSHKRTFVGTLLSVDDGGLTLSLDNGTSEQVRIAFDDATQFCRRGCAASWSDLDPGDAVNAYARLDPGAETRVAEWVNANGTAGYGEVLAVQGDELAVVLSRPGRPDRYRTLLLEPYTRVEFNGVPTHSIEPGDVFYFTGAGDSAGAATIWAYFLLIGDGS